MPHDQEHPAHGEADTDVTVLGSMPYDGPLIRLQGTRFDLCHYRSSRFGPCVAAHWTDRTGPAINFCSVRAEAGAIDPHVIEAFRRARERGLISPDDDPDSFLLTDAEWRQRYGE